MKVFNMYDWKYQFNQKDLKKAQDLTLVNVERKEDRLTADIKDSEFKIEVQIKYNSPYYILCNCNQKDCCPHEAAFWYYVEEHPELFKTPQKDIDENYYYNELDRIVDLGKGRDYQYHEILDFNRMAGSLSRFIREDIENLLNDGGYELACELLCSVSDLLSDEYAVDSDMWYDVAWEFCQCANPLTGSIHIDDDLAGKLDGKISNVSQYGV